MRDGKKAAPGSNVPSVAASMWPINFGALHGCCSLHCGLWLSVFSNNISTFLKSYESLNKES